MLHGNPGQTEFWYQIFVAYTKANLAYNCSAPVRRSKISLQPAQNLQTDITVTPLPEQTWNVTSHTTFYVKFNLIKFKTQGFTLSIYHYLQAILDSKMVLHLHISSGVMKKQK